MNINKFICCITVFGSLSLTSFANEEIRLLSNHHNGALSRDVNQTFEVGKPTELTKKVFMHYLSWFGEGKSGRHWNYGVVSEPLIGYYDSRSWATHLYHILLSASVGIDGAVINVRTKYDQDAFDAFVKSLDRIDEIYPDFVYDVSISYDDQSTTTLTATNDFVHLRDKIFPNTKHYLHKDGKPVVFLWDYVGNLTSNDYRNVANSVLSENPPIVLKNEIDSYLTPNEFVMNAFYPWVQGWAKDGSNWGEEYINWFYRTQVHLKAEKKVEFIAGGVWPGFDDRQASWGKKRWIDRKNGDLYNTLWKLITKDYNNDIDWVILETWNDFNEGSELEPTSGDKPYFYMELTAQHIATYKGIDIPVTEDKDMFEAVTKIYEAAKLIEDGDRDYEMFYPKLQKSIEHYLKTNGKVSYAFAEEIIRGIY
ncbi:hypothetical protein CBF23_000690 [Marinomonas agarivorans]|nr:hypothetical protein CBF23_000690 [Marinomonas agarivorans]